MGDRDDGCRVCGDIYSVPDGYEDGGVCWECELTENAAAVATLRTQLAEAKSEAKGHAANTQAERQRAVEWWDKYRAANADNARLREALRAISAQRTSDEIAGADGYEARLEADYDDAYDLIIGVARQALADTPEATQ